MKECTYYNVKATSKLSLIRLLVKLVGIKNTIITQVNQKFKNY